ncbi:hypothetical protein PVAP13_5KG180807 [Panicum virgatum]|uniref:Uncharacterized protein n=1 Tax=Panicum virgatum TaxID=38727 RepID=A0A8T0SEZ2_PANVG|nr:hypothetical protein PVAP13_5KG180807 [Panicum virgatum]
MLVKQRKLKLHCSYRGSAPHESRERGRQAPPRHSRAVSYRGSAQHKSRERGRQAPPRQSRAGDAAAQSTHVGGETVARRRAAAGHDRGPRCVAGGSGAGRRHASLPNTPARQDGRRAAVATGWSEVGAGGIGDERR